MCKILIIVLSHTDNNNGVYDKFYDTQKKTWDSINVEGVTTLYNYGDANYNHIVDNKINVITSEDHFPFNTGVKTLECFETILNNNLEFDFIFRTNSSSYVDKQKLKDLLIGKPKINYYAGVAHVYQGIHYVSGSGIVLSKDLVKHLVDNKHKCRHDLIDDPMIGEILNGDNIYPEHLDRNDTVNELISVVDLNHFLYRLKSDDRMIDINNMYKIHELKSY